eukprot:4794829-Pyramimonas_sp.AAC.1
MARATSLRSSFGQFGSTAAATRPTARAAETTRSICVISSALACGCHDTPYFAALSAASLPSIKHRYVAERSTESATCALILRTSFQ